jgi:predicted secreted protein
MSIQKQAVRDIDRIEPGKFAIYYIQSAEHRRSARLRHVPEFISHFPGEPINGYEWILFVGEG